MSDVQIWVLIVSIIGGVVWAGVAFGNLQAGQKQQTNTLREIREDLHDAIERHEQHAKECDRDRLRHGLTLDDHEKRIAKIEGGR